MLAKRSRLGDPHLPAGIAHLGKRTGPYFAFMELSLNKGRNAKAVYQDGYDHGFTGRYQSVKRFVRQACAVIVTRPGEGYGKSASWY